VRRPYKVALQLGVSGALVAVLLWQIDVSRTVDLVVSSSPGYLLAALAIWVATTWLLAWRWQILLASKGIHEPLGWLTKLYFLGYAAGQVLPTSIGGDALRIVEHARRRRNARGEAAGAVLMERVLGAAGTLLLVAVGLAIAAGRYPDLGFFVWIEAISVLFVAMGLVLVFSRRSRTLLETWIFPLGRRIRIERALNSVYGALHGYRAQPGAVAAVLAITVFVQFVRVLAIWMCGEAVGVDLSPLVYIILGPLLFLVMLIPFTINGLGAREAFFVAFLSRFDVDADSAFAIGFLFYAVTIAAAIPGALILLWQSVRPAPARPSVE
jgi:glycosyltransferase 2 family protein